MVHAAITAVGHYLPEDRLTNADLEKMIDTTDEWIYARTGIRERRILKDPEKATSYMAAEAARMILERRQIDPKEIDTILVATVTPDMFFPATACLVQAEIGASNAWGFDLSAACSGFLFALSTGARFIESGHSKMVLVIGADKMSSIVDYTDRTTCVIFGDGAGAVLLEPDTEGYGLLDSI
ncbi:MAG: beta-ketoacyl-ACP synthase 3 [Bacteroidetes bacterium]|nr:beta-ketoacyl-ACP synthase 3 [Bacteroidota bacterium]